MTVEELIVALQMISNEHGSSTEVRSSCEGCEKCKFIGHDVPSTVLVKIDGGGDRYVYIGGEV